MTGFTARLGNRLARLGRIRLGEAPAVPSAISATMPMLVVEFSPTTPPMAGPAWVDITEHVMAFSTARGRQRDTDRVEAGTLSLTLANDDRRFDPTNDGGPYAGTLTRRRRIRVRAIWDGVDYPVWSGYVERWGIGLWRHGRQVSRVTATDGFDLLAQKQVSEAFPEQTTGARIGAILDAAGWSTGQPGLLDDPTYGLLNSTMLLSPVGAKALDDGQTTVQAATLSNTTVLQHMQTMALAEQGLLFIDGEGTVTYHSRHHRAYPRAISATFGSDVDGGDLPFEDAALDDRPSTIYNEVRITRSGGAEHVALDQDAIDEFFGQTFSATLPLTTDAEAAEYAAWRLARSLEFPIRIAELAVAPPADARLWPLALGLDLSDKVRVRYQPPHGSALDQTSWVERVEHAYSAERRTWETSWSLTPGAQLEAYILDTSALDADAVLIY